MGGEGEIYGTNKKPSIGTTKQHFSKTAGEIAGSRSTHY